MWQKGNMLVSMSSLSLEVYKPRLEDHFEMVGFDDLPGHFLWSNVPIKPVSEWDLQELYGFNGDQSWLKYLSLLF